MVIIRSFIFTILFLQFSYAQNVNWVTIEKAHGPIICDTLPAFFDIINYFIINVDI